MTIASEQPEKGKIKLGLGQVMAYTMPRIVYNPRELSMKSLVAIFAFLFSVASLAGNAANSAIWLCSGTDIENASIFKSGNGYMAFVQWDCFPGGGICSQKSVVSPSKIPTGDIIFNGINSNFRLIVHTATAAPTATGAFHAYIQATDKGQKLNQNVVCVTRR